MNDKRFLLTITAICIAGLILCGFLFHRYASFAVLVIAFAGSIVAGLAIAKYIDIARYEQERRKGRKCRMCGQRKGTMAIEYGDDEGICRDCLNEAFQCLLPSLVNELMPILQKGQEGKTE